MNPMSTQLSRDECDQDQLPPYAVRRWKLEEYHALIDQGMFEEERVELLEGWIVPKMTRNPPHDATVSIIDEVLRPLIPTGFHLRIQCAVTLADSEAEPDLAIVTGRAQDYLERHPGKGNVELVIEVSDKSLRQDRRKAAIYADLCVSAYWIVNLAERQVEVFQAPDQKQRQFSSSTIYLAGESINVVLGNMQISIPVDSLLPTK